jgi:O-antigen/teichoic acid export membrane protein
MRRARVELRTLGRLLSFGGWVAVSGVVGPILVYIDRFVIAVLLSLSAVGYYAAPYEVVTRLSIIPVSLVAALFPVFSARNEASREVEALATRSLEILLSVMGAVTLVAVALAEDISWSCRSTCCWSGS